MDLMPGQSVFLHASHRKVQKMKPWKYPHQEVRPIEIKGPWKLEFTDGGPALPKDRVLDSLVSWTDLPDSAARWFSGTAKYSTRFMSRGSQG